MIAEPLLETQQFLGIISFKPLKSPKRMGYCHTHLHRQYEPANKTSTFNTERKNCHFQTFSYPYLETS